MMSSGYWQRPDLTAASFVEHPTIGLIYRTGDIGKWCQKQLHVLGRLDRQVKIRGCRVELQEVEIAVQPFVEEVAVVAAEGAQSHLQIVAFVGPPTLDVDALKQQMQEHLLPHLVPSLFIALSLPRLPNYKVDLLKLRTAATDALTQQSRETYAVLDSLGLLQHLTKTQLEEDKWMQNQQAFWLLTVMMEHFKLVSGSAGDAGSGAIQAMALLSHNKDPWLCFWYFFSSNVCFTEKERPFRF